MLQDLYPHVYHNEMAWKVPAPDDIALIFAPDRTIYCGLEGRIAPRHDGRDKRRPVRRRSGREPAPLV